MFAYGISSQSNSILRRLSPMSVLLKPLNSGPSWTLMRRCMVRAWGPSLYTSGTLFQFSLVLIGENLKIWQLYDIFNNSVIPTLWLQVVSTCQSSNALTKVLIKWYSGLDVEELVWPLSPSSILWDVLERRLQQGVGFTKDLYSTGLWCFFVIFCF